MTSRLVGLARAPQTQLKPSCSKRGCCGGTSSERTNVRMVPLVATNFLKLTCWKLQERYWRALCSFLTCCAVACVTRATATSVSRLSSWMGTASYPAAFAAGTWLKSGIIAVCSSRSWSVALANRLCALHPAALAPEHQDCEMIEAHKVSRSTPPSHTRCASWTSVSQRTPSIRGVGSSLGVFPPPHSWSIGESKVHAPATRHACLLLQGKIWQPYLVLHTRN